MALVCLVRVDQMQGLRVTCKSRPRLPSTTQREFVQNEEGTHGERNQEQAVLRRPPLVHGGFETRRECLG